MLGFLSRIVLPRPITAIGSSIGKGANWVFSDARRILALLLLLALLLAFWEYRRAAAAEAEIPKWRDELTKERAAFATEAESLSKTKHALEVQGQAIVAMQQDALKRQSQAKERFSAAVARAKADNASQAILGEHATGCQSGAEVLKHKGDF